MNKADSSDERDANIAALARTNAKQIRTLAMQGDAQTLSYMTDALARRLQNFDGVGEHLVRITLTCGPLTAGHLLQDMLQKVMDLHAELDADATVYQLERQRAAAPAECAA